MYNEIIIKNKVDTVTKAFNYAVKKYGNRDCLGTRQVLGRLSHPCKLPIMSNMVKICTHIENRN